MSAKIKRNICRMKDPGSAITHLIAMVAAAIASVPLLIKAAKTPGYLHLAALAVFILSMFCLYGASTLYHTLNISPVINKRLRKLDHMMIFVLIAGTYTPVCLIVLGDHTGWNLLGLVWGIALVGIIINALWITQVVFFPDLYCHGMGVHPSYLQDHRCTSSWRLCMAFSRRHYLHRRRDYICIETADFQFQAPVLWLP